MDEKEIEQKAFEYLKNKYNCAFDYETIMRNPIWQNEYFAFCRGYKLAMKEFEQTTYCEFCNKDAAYTTTSNGRCVCSCCGNYIAPK